MKIKTNLRAGISEDVTVYGADWCGWTTKQKDYLTAKGIDFTYVNCDQENCPSSVEAFPTLKVGGKMMTGYNEI